MALTITPDPMPNVLSRNQLKVRVQTDNYVTQQGFRASIDIEFTGAPNDGDSITFNYTDNEGIDRSITLTCTSNPDDSGNEFPVKSASESLDDYVQSTVRNRWRTNYILYRDFEIRHSLNVNANSEINMTALFDGNLNISLPNILSNTNATIIEGDYQITRPNFRIIMGVYMERTYKTALYQELTLLKKQVSEDDNGNYYADFFVDSILDNDYILPELPDYAQYAIKEVTGPLKQFLLKAAEQYGDPPDAQAYETAGIATVFRGRLNYLDYKDAGTFQDKILANNLFFTDEPDSKPVATDQQEYLYWYNNHGSDINAELRAEIHYKDGSNSTYTLLSWTATNERLYSIPAGVAELNIEGQNTNKTTKHYKLTVTDNNGNAKSETRTYVIDRRVYPYDRRFLFENNYGVFDTLRCTGQQVESYNNSKEVVRKGGQDHKPEAHDFEIFKSNARQEYEISTGYMSRERLLYIKRCLSSYNVYRIEPDNYLPDYAGGGLFVPVVINADTFELLQDGSGLYTLKFTYKEAFKV